MLKSLTIKNLAIAKNVNIDFSKGMNTITGETGAGKSIMLDALGLTLGNKVSSKLIGLNGDNAFVSSVFDLENTTMKNLKICYLKMVIVKKKTTNAFLSALFQKMEKAKRLSTETLALSKK